MRYSDEVELILHDLTYEYTDKELFEMIIRLTSGNVSDEDRTNIKRWYPNVQYHTAVLALSTVVLIDVAKRAIAYSPYLHDEDRIVLHKAITNP